MLVYQINVSCQKMSDSVFFLLLTNKLYEKENTKKLKNFPAGYVGSFYRNLADNISTNSHFYFQIAADADIPKGDVQKYILATTDFAKSIQTDINHYVRDGINNASFRQRLDPISKNILRRQNPLDLVFEDISTFDAENRIVGRLLREIDIKKKQSDSDFIKSLPSHPGKEFEIQKRLDNLRVIENNNNNDNNNNNNNNNDNNRGNSNLFDIGDIPSSPKLEDFIGGGLSPFNTPAQNSAIIAQQNQDIFQNRLERERQRELSSISRGIVQKGISNLLDNENNQPSATKNFLEETNTKLSQQTFDGVLIKSLFDKEKTKTQNEIDDFLYEIPDNM